MLSIRYAEHIAKCLFHISLFLATLPCTCILIGIKTFDKMFNVIFHDVTYHAFELKFHSKQRNSDYLLHGRWEIGGSVGTANKKQVFFY